MPLRRRDLLRAPQLMLLLLVTLAVAALAAFEAEGDVGAHRATAERALGDYLGVVGRDAVGATVGAVASELTTVLAPAAGARAASPYDPLPPPVVLERSLATLPRGAFACADGEPPLLVLLDLRDGVLTTAGVRSGDATRSAAMTQWLRDTLAATVMRGNAPSAVAGTIPIGVLFGRGAAAGRAVAYGVKRAPFDVPIGVYGVATCAAAFGAPLVARASARAPAFAALAADSMLVVTSGDAALAASAGAPPDASRAVAEARLGGLVVRAAAGPGAARRLVVRPGSRPRIVLLGVLAAATASLVLVALAQLGREQELVRLRADFTSSVSHELRTPLTQILLYGETLALGRTRGDADRRAAAETIVREARRLMGMVENVLHVARAERRANAACVPIAVAARAARRGSRRGVRAARRGRRRDRRRRRARHAHRGRRAVGDAAGAAQPARQRGALRPRGAGASRSAGRGPTRPRGCGSTTRAPACRRATASGSGRRSCGSRATAPRAREAGSGSPSCVTSWRSTTAARGSRTRRRATAARAVHAS